MVWSPTHHRRWVVPLAASLLGLSTSVLIIVPACSDRTPTVEDDGVPAEVKAYAEARCRRLDECGCESDVYEAREQCEDRILAIYEDIMDERGAVDLECFGAAASAWNANPCDNDLFEAACDVAPPMGEVGDPCRDTDVLGDVFIRAPSCVAGLFCWEGSCIDPVVPDTQLGDPCSSEGLCGSDLVCFGGRCEAPHVEGEPCESGATCSNEASANLYCTSGTCTVQKAEGEPCENKPECLSHLMCVGGRCVEPPVYACWMAEF